MSLHFLGMDDERGCPECHRSDAELIYTSFSRVPVSCSVCVLMRKAEPTWEDAPESEPLSDADMESLKAQQLAWMQSNRSPLQDLLYGKVKIYE